MKTPKILLILLLVITSCKNTAEVQTTNTDATYFVSESTVTKNVPFSDAVIKGDIIYLSGKIGMLDDNLVEGGIGPETVQTFTRIKEALEKYGSSMDNVIKCTCMLADMNEWSAMNKEYVKFFPKNKPARSAFGASGLARNARVEIECIAYINEKK